MIKCKWVIAEYDLDIVWITGCENIHIFLESGPKDNGYNFCPYCGGELEVTK